jgi:hypothetical protein
MNSIARSVVLIALMCAAGAAAQKPRVMVILDTSRSMMEYPVFSTCPACADTAIPLDPAQGGDYSPPPSGAPPCVSKFCIAKEAVYQTIPSYADDAVIGLSTYYQYIMKTRTSSTQTTTCRYDVFAPPDIRKSFTSPIDFTGSGLTHCGSVGGNALSPDTLCVPGMTRTSQLYFPDSTFGGGAGLNAFCPYPAGITSPASATANPVACGADTRNCYVLTKTAANPSMPIDCNIYSWPVPALPASIPGVAANGAGCQPSLTYHQVVAPAVFPTGGRMTDPTRIEQIVTSASTCPTAVAPVINPVDPPSVTFMANQPVGSAVGQWRNFFAAGTSCSAGTPCSLFSYSATPRQRDYATSWYAFFEHPSLPAVTPAPTTPALTGTYQFSQYSAGPPTAYSAAVLSGSRLLPMTTACPGGGLPAATGLGVGTTAAYNSNETLAGTFGISNAPGPVTTPQAALDASGVSRGTRRDDTPGRVGTNYTCTAGWPCHVTLNADVSVPGMWVNNVATIYADVYNVTNERTTPIASDNFTLRLLAPQVTCPAVGSNGAAPANTQWHPALPAGCTGAGQGACAFTSAGMGAPASTGACPTVVRWSNTGAQATPPGNCPFNNKAYSAGVQSAPITVTRTITSGSCTAGTFDISNATNGAPATTPPSPYVGCGGYPCKLTAGSPLSSPGAPVSSSWGANRYHRTTPPPGFGSAGTPATRDQVVGTVSGTGSSPAFNGRTATLSNVTCIGGNNSFVNSTDASLCPGGVQPCTLYQLGPQQVSPTGCGTENGPCYACVYEQRRYQWDVPSTVCTYTANTYTFTVDNTAPTCNYTRARWQLDRRDPDQHRCEYRVGAKRYDFAPPREWVCQYWTVRSTMRSNQAIYTYEYKTKGTELIGRASADAPGAMCGANGSGSYDATFQAACPQTTPCTAFATMKDRTNSLGGGSGAMPAGTTCKLHWGAGNHPNRIYGYTPYASAGGAVCGTGRCLTGDSCSGGLCYTNGAQRGRAAYAGAAPVTTSFSGSPLTNNTRRLCEENPTGLPGSPDAYQVALPSTAQPMGFCSNSGTPSVTSYHLVSDYYDPSMTNDLSLYTGLACPNEPATAGPPAQPAKPCFRTVGPTPPYSSVTWTQTPGGAPGPDCGTCNSGTNNKLQGLGARQGVTAAAGSGDVPPVSLLVPIPDDDQYDDNTEYQNQMNKIRAATSLCVMPSADVSPADGVQDGPNNDGSLRGGACVSDFADKRGTGYNDFTPLYGAIRNAADYLTNRWANEGIAPNTDYRDCRENYIILATDGLEKTPAGFTLEGTSVATSVQGLVGSLREFAVPRTKPDIKTFVIGFGDGAAGAGVTALNAVAAAGGTTNAYFPSSLAALQSALNAVFTNILMGVETRSKPALGTDGTRLYAAQYVKPASPGAADWYGLFTAYGVDATTGAPTIAWEHHNKLNNPAHPARHIRGIVKHSDHVHSDQFVPGMNFRDSPMDTHGGFNGSLPDGGDPDVDDVITFMRNRGEPYQVSSGSLTVRASALGPIINSSPVVVGKSPFDDSYGGSTAGARTAFRSFINSTSSRGTRIYFAAGDGMIHSVIEGTDGGTCATETSIGCPNGREDWSIVPLMMPRAHDSYGGATLGERLYELPVKGAWNQKILNGTVSIADVCNEYSDYDGPADNCTAGEWHTILIASMREGGRGLMAFDITDHTPPTGTSNGSNNGVLWYFSDGDLGLTYSVPAIGRIRISGEDKFIAFFGGGKKDPNNSTGQQGQRVYVVDALAREDNDDNHAVVYADLWQYQRGSTQNQNLPDEVIARPATYRRPGNPYIDTGFFAAGAKLYATRFGRPDGTQWGNVSSWQPDEFFDPTSSRNDKAATSPTTNTVVNRVSMIYAGNAADPNDPPRYELQADGALPLASAPPLYNRPKMANVLVPAGGKPDLYVGTGDSDRPTQPAGAFVNENYFYAIHDFNDQTHGTVNDGRALWVAKFCNGALAIDSCAGAKEMVVSEPAIISSCIVVPTFRPDANCSEGGKVRLYGFNLTTGALTPCLVHPPGSPWAGTATPVVEITGGVPSDLVVINDNLYFTMSGASGMNQVGVRQNPTPGAVRSFRRIK